MSKRVTCCSTVYGGRACCPSRKVVSVTTRSRASISAGSKVTTCPSISSWIGPSNSIFGGRA